MFYSLGIAFATVFSSTFLVFRNETFPLPIEYHSLNSAPKYNIDMEFKAAGINNNKVREKVAVKPGFHLIDWNRLVRSMSTVFGKEAVKITLDELATHNNKYDCWMAYKGKVYNVTQYMAYHPGGEEILMEYAGKDCSEGFDQYHKWVNIQAMLGKCLVGVLEAPIVATAKVSAFEGTEDEKLIGNAKSILSENEDAEEKYTSEST